MNARRLVPCLIAAVIGLGCIGATASADYVDAVTRAGTHVPCGLVSHYTPNGNPDANPSGLYFQSVGNCHYYSVYRAIIYDGGARGACRLYVQHRGITLATARKPLYLVAC
jgi:hypothetical protein